MFFNLTGLLDGFKGAEGRNSRRSLTVRVGKSLEQSLSVKATGLNKSGLCSKSPRRDLTKFCSFDKVLIKLHRKWIIFKREKAIFEEKRVPRSKSS